MPNVNIRQLITDSQSAYTEKRKFHGLVIGEKGVGKTTFAATAPLPLVIFSFDPGGTSLPCIKRLVDEGNALVLPFDGAESIEGPYDNMLFPSFQRLYTSLGTEGFYDHCGTIIIDSITTLAEALIAYLVRRESRRLQLPGVPSKGSGMELRDWGTLSNGLIYLVNSLASAPCHTLMIGHINKERDEVFGGFVKTLLVSGRSSHRLPIGFGEFYALLAKKTSKGLERYLLTSPEEDIPASTRLGAEGLLAPHETPNLTALMNKVGLSTAPKPPFTTLTLA